MRTDKQNDASKTNGAKSNGPVTPEGKAKSSQNGMRHNLSGGHVVLLSNEDPDIFIAHSYGFLDRFAPADYVERDLVDQMIAASWRLARISAIECSRAEIEMEDHREEHDEEYSYLDAHTRQTLSYFGNTDKQAVSRMLQRYQAAASRAYSRAFRMLKELQGDRFGRLPAAPPVTSVRTEPVQTEPVQTENSPAQTTPEQNRDLQEPQAYAPKIVVINRRNPEKSKLQSEPETLIDTAYPPATNLQKARCA